MASATGPSDARFETTAAYQAAETSTSQLQHDVEKNARAAQAVAQQAADVAPLRAPATEGAIDQLEEGLSDKTDAAVAEGQYSVESAKATGAGYVEQAKNLANSAIATASAYLPSAASTTSGLQSAAGTAVEVGKNAAGTAVEVGKNALSSAQQTMQPHIDNAMQAAQPTIDRLSGAISGHSQATGKPDEVRATTAPLESGGGMVPGPYPETAKGGKSTVGNL